MVLKVKGISKFFKGVDGEPDFFLELPKLELKFGDIIYIMGHNGSGKTVLLKLLSGQILPTSGYIEISNANTKWKPQDRASSIVRQNVIDSLALDLTVQENLLLRLKTDSFLDRFFPTNRLRKRVEGLVSQYEELSKKLDQPCRNLSGGQKQTLSFLMATSNDTEMLFLDEFLAATDQKTTDLLLGLAIEYAIHTPACVLVVSHDLDLALSNANRIIILKDGSLLKDLSPDDLDWNRESLRSIIT